MATGDINGDGRADLITAAGPGGGPQINVYLGTASGGFLSGLSLAFYALGPTLPGYTGGIYITAMDVNGDGKADLFCGAGSGSCEVTLFSGAQLTAATPNFDPLTAFFAPSGLSFDHPSVTSGVRVGTAVGLLTGGQVGPILLTSAGPGGFSEVDEFNAPAIFDNPSVQPGPLNSLFVPVTPYTVPVFVSVT